MGRRTAIVLIAASLSGLAIAWLDGRPGWDDTGITAGLLLLSSSILSVFEPKRLWAIVLLTGGWIAGRGLVEGRPDTVLALGFSAAGGLLGYAAGRALSGPAASAAAPPR